MRIEKSITAINDLFGTKYKNLHVLQRKILEPIKEELEQNSELSFLQKINFDNFKRGKPKAIKITINLIDNKKRRQKKGIYK